MFASESVKPLIDKIVSDDSGEDRRDAANDPSLPRMFQKDNARFGIADAVI